MSWFLLTSILAVLYPVCGAAVSQSIMLPGDVYIGGLFAVQTNTNGRCDKMDLDSVMHVEAVIWTLDNFNRAGYIPGVKIGFLAFKTCGLTEHSIVFANKLLDQHGYCANLDVPNVNGSMTILGIIGPEYDEEAKVVSKIINLLPTQNKVPHVGFSVTSMDFDDKKTYPLFLRTTPSDAVELQVFKDLLHELDWNFITIIHESDAYNTNYALRIENIIKINGVCVQALHQINNMNGVNPDEIRRIFLNITVQEDSAIRGVIFIGSTSTAHALLLVADALQIVNKMPVFVFSNSLSMKENTFINNQHIIGAAKGSIHLSPIKRNVVSFSKHWLDIFQNNSRLTEESKGNTWLLDLFEQISECKAEQLENSMCELTEKTLSKITKQSLYVSYAIEAVFAMAKGIQEIHSETCGNNFGICQRFNELELNNFFNKLQNLEYSLTTDSGTFNLSSLYHETSEFDQKKIGSHPVYGVYIYQSKSSSDNNFDFKEVGNFQNKTLQLSKTDFKFYDKDGTEISEFPVAQCEAGKECKKCQKTKAGFYYIPGDYIIVIGVSIYDRGERPLTCSNIRPTIGLDLALGAVYVVNKFNQKNGIYSRSFVNKTIGVLVIDTCNDPLLIQKQVLNLQGNHDIYPRILGFVGDVGSSTTVKFAEITGVLKHPHVGFASTTYLLSDRYRFPYFARVSMEMKKQAKGMVKMADLIGANYVQIIYSSGEYGEAGKHFIEEFVKSYSICIAQTAIEVPEGSSYYNILPRLRKKPHARVVFVILRSHVGPEVMKAIDEDIGTGEFVFIGAEAWGSRSEYLKLNLRGSVSFSQYIPQDPDFELFLQQQKPNVTDKNPWLLDFFQTRLNCYFSWSFDKTKLRECDSADVLTGVGMLDPWIPYIMLAVESLLFGADKSLKFLCGENGGLCEEYRRNPSLVMKYTRAVRLNDRDVFSADGEGTLGYTIYNIQKHPKDPLRLIYKKVGILTADGELKVLKQDLVDIGEPSVCPNTQACDCHGNTTESSSAPSAQNGYFYATIALAGISCLVTILLLAFMIKYCRSKGSDDDTYITPTDDTDQYHKVPQIKRGDDPALQSVTTFPNKGYSSD